MDVDAVLSPLKESYLLGLLADAVGTELTTCRRMACNLCALSGTGKAGQRRRVLDRLPLKAPVGRRTSPRSSSPRVV
jgi:hypothetical protein